MAPIRPPERRPLVPLISLAALAALAGCRSLPPAANALDWSARCAALTTDSYYSFSGRIAAGSGGNGFSAGIDWQQRGEQSEATLRGPLGVGAIHLHIDHEGISVDDGAGQRNSGSEGHARLRELLGFDPPMNELRYWLLACSAPGTPTLETPDATQRLVALNQSGWQLEYTQYQNVAPYVLPLRLRARRGDDSLRLVINRWRLR
jgi:outer membrane lipoprotein LolB